jgi:hypothetical protein
VLRNTALGRFRLPGRGSGRIKRFIGADSLCDQPRDPITTRRRRQHLLYCLYCRSDDLRRLLESPGDLFALSD